MARGQPTAARSNAKKGKNTASNKARASSTAKKTAPRRKGVPRNTAVKGRADNASDLPSEDSHCLVPPSVGEDDATLLMQEKFLSNSYQDGIWMLATSSKATEESRVIPCFGKCCQAWGRGWQKV